MVEVALQDGPASTPTLHRVLRGHPAFVHWTKEQIAALDGHSRFDRAGPGDLLQRKGSIDPFILFLIDGALLVSDGAGLARRVTTGSDDVRFPVARLRPSLFDVASEADSQLLKVEQSVLQRITASGFEPAPRVRFDLFSPPVSGSWQHHPLVDDLGAARDAGALELPVIPAIALKVRQALAREDVQMKDVARIIAADPVISARLLKVANSSLFVGRSPCDSLQQAVVRLGVNRVQNLVLALASARLFSPTDGALKQRLGAVWRHLLKIGSLCAALARLSQKLDPDLALLVGLLHEVGKIPILVRAMDYPDLRDTPGLLDDILAALGPQLTVATLSAWGLADAVLGAADRQHQWNYDHEGDVDTVDLLLVAHVFDSGAQSGTHADSAPMMPPLTEIPAFSKITGRDLTAQESLTVLKDAQAESQALRSLLSGG
ncbi:MAG: HDOD domain-containing protein [Pseudomonadota bacterium]